METSFPLEKFFSFFSIQDLSVFTKVSKKWRITLYKTLEQDSNTPLFFENLKLIFFAMLSSFSDLKYHTIKELRSLETIFEPDSSLNQKIEQVVPLITKIFNICLKNTTSSFFERLDSLFSPNNQASSGFGSLKQSSPYEILLTTIIKEQHQLKQEGIIEKFEKFDIKGQKKFSSYFIQFIEELIFSKVKSEFIIPHNLNNLQTVFYNLIPRFTAVIIQLDKTNQNHLKLLCSNLEKSNIKKLTMNGFVDKDQYVIVLKSVSHSVEELTIGNSFDEASDFQVDIDFPKLKVLRSYNNFGEKRDNSFKFNLSNLLDLEALNLEDKAIKKNICELISKSKKLKNIYLRDYSMVLSNDITFEFFCESLAKSESIEKIKFKEPPKGYENTFFNDSCYEIHLRKYPDLLKLFFDSVSKMPNLNNFTLPTDIENYEFLNDFLANKKFSNLIIYQNYDKNILKPLKYPVEVLQIGHDNIHYDLYEIFQPKNIHIRSAHKSMREFISKVPCEELTILTSFHLHHIIESINSNQNIKKLILEEVVGFSLFQFAISLLERKIPVIVKDTSRPTQGSFLFWNDRGSLEQIFKHQKDYRYYFELLEEIRCKNREQQVLEPIPVEELEKYKNGEY